MYKRQEHPRPAPRLSRTPGTITGRPPRVGEQTRAVLTDWGFAPAEIADGIASGVFLDTAA